MKVAICDDNLKCLDEYRGKLTAIFEENKIAATVMSYQTCKELMFAMEGDSTKADVIFLDINMPFMNGMEVAHWLRVREISCEIVFLTVSQTHMLDAFDVSAFHYVIKDVTPPEKLEEICVRAAGKVGKQKQEFITVACAGESRRISIRDILYFEVQNYIIIVHYGDEKFEFYSTLGKLENTLGGHGFVRTHRSYLVNLDHIHALMRQELELENGSKIPVGRKYAEEIKKMLQERAKA